MQIKCVEATEINGHPIVPGNRDYEVWMRPNGAKSEWVLLGWVCGPDRSQKLGGKCWRGLTVEAAKSNWGCWSDTVKSRAEAVLAML